MSELIKLLSKNKIPKFDLGKILNELSSKHGRKRSKIIPTSPPEDDAESEIDAGICEWKENQSNKN